MRLLLLLLISAIVQASTVLVPFERRLHRSQSSKSRLHRRVNAWADKVNRPVLAGFSDKVFVYAVNVSVGTPPQLQTMQFDTGSSDIIVRANMSYQCANWDDWCPPTDWYHPNKSKSYEYINSKLNVSYGFADFNQGSGATGDVVKDTFHIGGAEIKGLQLGVGYHADVEIGILGGSYPRGEMQTNVDDPNMPYDNLPSALARQGQTQSPLYSVWNDNHDLISGKILFGGVDTKKYIGNLTTYDMVITDGSQQPSSFDIRLDEITLEGRNSSLIPKNQSAVAILLDTGTSQLYLPDRVAFGIIKSFGLKYDYNTSQTQIDCDMANANETVTFRFGKLKIAVPMASMVSHLPGNDDCYLEIVPSLGRSLILGTPFLVTSYVVYDLWNNQISLALTNFSSDESHVVPVGKAGIRGTNLTSSALSTKPDVSISFLIFLSMVIGWAVV